VAVALIALLVGPLLALQRHRAREARP
jgi:hypothetical protein